MEGCRVVILLKLFKAGIGVEYLNLNSTMNLSHSCDLNIGSKMNKKAPLEILDRLKKELVYLMLLTVTTLSTLSIRVGSA